MFSRPVQRLATAAQGSAAAAPTVAAPETGSAAPVIAHSIGITVPVTPPARPNRTGLPDDLKRGVEGLSGLAMDDVRVHRNSARPGALGAHAYAQGSHIHLAPGQERHLPHEAWHVVQQKHGRVKATMQLKGGVPVNDDAALEREADAMGARLASGLLAPVAEAAASCAMPPTTLVQRQLARVPNAPHFTDSRDPTNRRFTPHQADQGLSGAYTCQDGFQYHYDDATKQYRVTSHNDAPAGYDQKEAYWDVANQREQVRVTTPHQGAPLHRYNGSNGMNFFDPTDHQFKPMPSPPKSPHLRPNWIDSRGRFVDDQHNRGQPARRVLTPDGLGVDKQYGVTKIGREFVAPYKKMNARFLRGLPNIYGGNIDPNESANDAVRREIREESGNRFTVAEVHQPPLALPPDAADANRYTINAVELAAQGANHVPRHEMAGEFRVTASDFVGHTADLGMVKTRLLNRFAQDQSVGAAHRARAAALTGNDRTDWMGSHSMTALATTIRADALQYEGGMVAARAGQALLPAASAEHQFAHASYHQGVAAARTDAADPGHREPAYRAGSEDYRDGLAAAQTNAAGAIRIGHIQAMADYQNGIVRARAGEAAGDHHAAQVAHGQYRLGYDRAAAGEPPEYDHTAYLAGHADAGQADLGLQSATKRRNTAQG